MTFTEAQRSEFAAGLDEILADAPDYTPGVVMIEAIYPDADAVWQDIAVLREWKQAGEDMGVPQIIARMFATKAWLTVDFDSWDDMCNQALGGFVPRFEIEDRREIVRELTEAGMSTRAIGAALGVGNKTVQRDQAAVSHDTPSEPPSPVTGLDGKTYTRPTRTVTVVEEVTVDAETGERVDPTPSRGDVLVQDLIDSSPDMRAANVRKEFSRWLLAVSQYHLFDPAEAAHVAPERLGDLDAFVRGINQLADTYRATVLEMHRPQLRSVK